MYYDFAAPRLHKSHSIGECEDISLVAHGKTEIRAHFEALEKHYLKNNNNCFLVGNQLTIADIYTAIIISPLQAVLFDFTPWPSLCKWFEEINKQMVTTTRRLSKLTSLSKIKLVQL